MPTFELDGRPVAFEPGQSILAAASDAIPHLCFDARLPAVGSCRMCLVRVNGRLMPACTTAAAEGQHVESETTELRDLRRDLLRFLFVEGNHFCPTCEATGDCRLQTLARRHGMLALEYQQQYPVRDLDASHPDVLLERDRCIFCGLCVRASRELDGKAVFDLGGRGAATRLFVNSSTGRLSDSALEADDEAVTVCPTGALTVRPKR